eukprot:SAG31_NODE_1577_length_7836_cov_3.212744_9_plen_177_part_00
MPVQYPDTRPARWVVHGLRYDMEQVDEKVCHIVEKCPVTERKIFRHDPDHEFTDDEEVVITRVYATFGDQNRVLCRRLRENGGHDANVVENGSESSDSPLISREIEIGHGHGGRTRVRYCDNLRNITEPLLHSIDFDSDDTIYVWKREIDVHHFDEYVYFFGRVSRRCACACIRPC